MKLKEILESFRSIEPQDYVRLKSSLLTYSGPPRFWHSLSYLASDKANLIGELNGFTIIIRCKVLHGHVVAYLPFLPCGNRDKITNFINQMLDSGISCKVTKEEIDLYGLEGKEEKGNIEYSYHGDIEKAMKGKSGKNIRYGRNLLTRRVELNELELVKSCSRNELISLAKRWKAQGGSVSNTERIIDAFLQTPEENRTSWAVKKDGALIAASLVEKTTPTSASIVVRIRDCKNPYATGMIDALHYLDLKHYADFNLTIGSSVGVKSLSEHKENLSLTNKVQIYTAQAKKGLTLEDYHEYKKYGATF